MNSILLKNKILSFIITFTIYFLSNILSAEEVNINLPPVPFAQKKMRLPSYQTFSLKNGLKVYLIEDHKLPMISYFLYLDYFPPLQKKKAGLGKFTTKLMKQGTANKTKLQIDEELDFMGVDFSIDDNLIFASSLKKYANQSLEIFSDIVKLPKFDMNEFIKVKEEMLSDIQSEKQDPSVQADNIAKSLLYPVAHPYSETATEKTVKQITIDDCKKYHAAYFKPNISHLAIMGDISLEDAKLLAETHFGNWQSAEIPIFKSPKLINPKKSKIYLMDRPDSVQSVIKISHNVELKPGEKDIYSAIVMNTLLGGGTFRLYQNLREKHGYTYGVYSSLRPDKFIGNFSVDLNTETSLTSKSIKEVFNELERIRKEKVSPEELQLVKNYLSGQFSLSLENPSTVALFGIKTSLYNLPVDYFEKYLAGIASVSGEDVLHAANKYILLDKTHIIIVGKKKILNKNLKSLKKFKIVEIKKG